jgi:hypothetical protein
VLESFIRNEQSWENVGNKHYFIYLFIVLNEGDNIRNLQFFILILIYKHFSTPLGCVFMGCYEDIYSLMMLIK